MSGKYYASILVDTYIKKSSSLKDVKSESVIGIDIGIKDFLIRDNGEKYKNNRYLEKSLKKLSMLQKKHSRKKRVFVEVEGGEKREKRNSRNREKSSIKIARLHEKISNQRLDYIHKITYRLTHDSQVSAICVEDLHIKGMMKNKKLSRNLNDVGMGLFFEVLKYKCDWYGVRLEKIGRFQPSSKQCHKCKWKNKNLTLKIRKWTCENCKTEHDRDINAAKNIKAFGLEKIGQELPKLTSVESTLAGLQSVNSVSSRGSVKQKKR